MNDVPAVQNVWPRHIVSLCLLVAVVGAMLLSSGCAWHDRRRAPVRPVQDQKMRVQTMEVTGYCPCGVCCDWRRNWRGRPVIASGPRKGQPKQVGVTASGARAQWGTIAADTRLYPFGTIMYVPGYGYGVVEDRGSAIQGHKIDLYFPSHHRALKWGRVNKRVKVWLPDRQ